MDKIERQKNQRTFIKHVNGKKTKDRKEIKLLLNEYYEDICDSQIEKPTDLF